MLYKNGRPTRILFLLFGSLMLPVIAEAQEDNRERRLIAFLNGIDTTFEGAQETAEILEDVYQREHFISDAEYRRDFLPAYGLHNPTDGFVLDLFQAGTQAGLIQEVREIWEILDNGLRLSKPAELANGIAQLFADGLIDIAEEYADAEADELLRETRLLLADSIKIGMVTHSQGNFFGNTIYQSLSAEERERVDLVAVATPATEVADGGVHVTAQCDIIRLVPRSASYNVPANECTSVFPPKACNVDCHRIEAYLDGQFGSLGFTGGETQDRIMAQLFDFFGPETEANFVQMLRNRSFTLGTLEWDLRGDFWAGTNLTNYRTAPGYAAGGVDSSGYHKNDADGTMSQAFEMPPGATSAAFTAWINVTTEEEGSEPVDKLEVELFDMEGKEVLASISNLDAEPLGVQVIYVVPISYLEPGPRLLRFRAVTGDDNRKTVFRIDDVSISVDVPE